MQQDIVERIAQSLGVSIEELRGNDRHQTLSAARAIAYNLLHKEGYSLREIEKKMGKTVWTIRHHIETHGGKMQSWAYYNKLYTNAEQSLEQNRAITSHAEVLTTYAIL